MNVKTSNETNQVFDSVIYFSFGYEAKSISLINFKILISETK